MARIKSNAFSIREIRDILGQNLPENEGFPEIAARRRNKMTFLTQVKVAIWQ
jgi:hypothetical protein